MPDDRRAAPRVTLAPSRPPPAGPSRASRPGASWPARPAGCWRSRARCPRDAAQRPGGARRPARRTARRARAQRPATRARPGRPAGPTVAPGRALRPRRRPTGGRDGRRVPRAAAAIAASARRGGPAHDRSTASGPSGSAPSGSGRPGGAPRTALARRRAACHRAAPRLRRQLRPMAELELGTAGGSTRVGPVRPGRADGAPRPRRGRGRERGRGRGVHRRCLVSLARPGSLPRAAPAIMRRRPAAHPRRGRARARRCARDPRTRPLVRAVPTIVRRTRRVTPARAWPAASSAARSGRRSQTPSRRSATRRPTGRCSAYRRPRAVHQAACAAAAGRLDPPLPAGGPPATCPATRAPPGPATAPRRRPTRRRHVRVRRAAPRQAAAPTLDAVAARPGDQRPPARRRAAPVPARASSGPARRPPTEGHIQAVNALIESLRRELLDRAPARSAPRRPRRAREPTATRACSGCWSRKERAHDWVRAIERIWDFYFELFGQRQSRFGDWLLALRPDRSRLLPGRVHGARRRAVDPGPPPVLATCAPGFSPATFRRGHPAAPARAAAQPVPAGPAALPPARQPVDARGRAARGAATTSRTTSGSTRRSRRRSRRGCCGAGCGAGRRVDLDAVEPRDRSPTCAGCCSAARRSSAR